MNRKPMQLNVSKDIRKPVIANVSDITRKPSQQNVSIIERKTKNRRCIINAVGIATAVKERAYGGKK